MQEEEEEHTEEYTEEEDSEEEEYTIAEDKETTTTYRLTISVYPEIPKFDPQLTPQDTELGRYDLVIIYITCYTFSIYKM